MTKTTCSIDGCSTVHYGRGWCRKHYGRWKRTGDPTLLRRIIGDDEARFWGNVDKGNPNDCWPWYGPLTPHGYGHMHYQGKAIGAHRVSYMLFVGPIPTEGELGERVTIDHLCHSAATPECRGGSDCPHRRCVNPAHLEPVSHRENIQRGYFASVTHCPQGHPYSGGNLYVNAHNGGRTCRTCARASLARHMARQRSSRTVA